MISVYIASPYSTGDQLENVNRSFDAYIELVKLGFFPYAPLHAHFIHERHPLPYEKWMMIDEYWLAKCDCVLRLEGDSRGADQECVYADALGKKVFYTIEELAYYYSTNDPNKLADIEKLRILGL
jgi:nucleoside 2-deoxyribosyltransferase